MSQYNILHNSINVLSQAGPAGENGKTPYIDPITYNWFIDGQDTGVPARGLNNILYYNDLVEFPVIGNENFLYIVDDGENTYPYVWVKQRTCYKALVPSINIINCGNSKGF